MARTFGNLMQLTRKQQEILDFLRHHADQLANPPTLDELCGLLGLNSRGSLHKHIQALVDAGLVEPMDGRHRGVRLTAKLDDESTRETLPFLGHIAAGIPIEPVAETERMLVPPNLRTNRPCFVLQVSGDSMCEAGILDGDYVVIESRNDAGNGDIVIALVHGEEATLKRIRQEPGRVTLIAENSAMSPLILAPSEVEIQGVLVGQMRAYR